MSKITDTTQQLGNKVYG